MRSDLSVLQLQIVMHVSNGMTFDEIARSLDRSLQNVKKHANMARQKTGARNLPQLVSILIAEGQLDWTEGQRVVRSADPVAN